MTGTKLSISPVHPGHPGLHVAVAPGEIVTIEGAFHCRHDGTKIDGATTAWPADAPGGPRVVPGGLIDFAAGGFEVTARDADSHQVEAVATGGPAPACHALGLEAPCLPLRTVQLAHERLLTVREYVGSLRGEMTVAVPEAPAAVAVETQPVGEEGPLAWLPQLALVGAVLWAAATVLVILWAAHRRWAGSARRRIARLMRQLDRTAVTADPVLSQVLAPALAGMARALRDRRLDPTSAEGQRLEQRLEQLHSDLVSSMVERKRLDEGQVADDLALQLQQAVDAAAEASRAA
ncbi:MAG: hypothetical protein JRI68_27680 [Deltaproteobacteria bacterium]|nr:hypothetical protein [Deltaproteobacteria bacterium]